MKKIHKFGAAHTTDKKHTLTAVEKVTLLKNKAHNHYNMDDEPAGYIQTTTHGMDVDLFVENLF